MRSRFDKLKALSPVEGRGRCRATGSSFLRKGI